MTARRFALAAIAIACACKPPPRTTKSADAMAPSGGAVDPLGDAESRIAENAAKMRALGIELAQTREESKKPDAPGEAEPIATEPTKPAPETELEKPRRKH